MWKGSVNSALLPDPLCSQPHCKPFEVIGLLCWGLTAAVGHSSQALETDTASELRANAAWALALAH